MNILLGLTGSVATRVGPKLIEALRPYGSVRVILTERAKPFIQQFPQGTEVFDDQREWAHCQPDDPVTHIELRKWADILVIAPLSAHTMAKLSHGLCDNLLTTVARAWDFSKPALVAPAMNTFMWDHTLTGLQVSHLERLGFQSIPPISKLLACGDVGLGAMAQIDTIVEQVRAALSWQFPLAANTCPGVQLAPHQGSFGAIRKHDVHTGVDLYCQPETPIYAAEAGKVTAIVPFTGPQVHMPWWLDTKSVFVEGASHTLNYGECRPVVNVGDTLQAGELLGHVIPVLPPHKLRQDIPNHATCMLHLEMYRKGNNQWVEWKLEQPKPSVLLDPTGWLLKAKGSSTGNASN